jgi:hypothetical protein
LLTLPFQILGDSWILILLFEFEIKFAPLKTGIIIALSLQISFEGTHFFVFSIEFFVLLCFCLLSCFSQPQVCL